MAVEIRLLSVQVRVRSTPRTSLGEADSRPGIKRGDQRSYLLPPPRPESASGESIIGLQGEESPEQMAWTAEEIDIYDLSDRVYDFMKYDIRIARERDGSS